MLVFVKQGVEVEPRQQAFIDRVQEYTGGRFRAGFTSAVDLQPKVARALAELAAQQAPLAFTPLPATADVAVPWVYDPAGTAGAFTSHAAILECHALPLATPRLPAASLDTLADRLAELGRLHRLFRTEQALQATSDPEGVARSEEHTSELQSRPHLVCRLLLEKKKARAVPVCAFETVVRVCEIG